MHYAGLDAWILTQIVLAFEPHVEAKGMKMQQFVTRLIHGKASKEKGNPNQGNAGRKQNNQSQQEEYPTSNRGFRGGMASSRGFRGGQGKPAGRDTEIESLRIGHRQSYKDVDEREFYSRDEVV